MGRDDSRRDTSATTGFATDGVDPVVVALGRARTTENLAMFEQLALIACLWTEWAPTVEELLDDRLRHRRDLSSWSLHEAEVTTETAVALGLTEAAASRRVHAAVALVVTRRLPRTAALATRGRLTWRQVDALTVKTRDLSPEQTTEVEERVLVRAVLGLTIGRFEDAVDRAVLAVDPVAAEERRREVRRGRRVAVFKQRNGTDGTEGGATFWAEGPADGMTAVMASLDASARWWQTQGDTRTLDQLRHDLFVTACTTGRLDVPHDVVSSALTGLAPDGGAAPAAAAIVLAPRPQVPVHLDVTVTLQTLLGLNDEPGTLDRYGPIPAQMVRELAADAIWRCVAVDDTHGTVLGVGRSTYTHGYVAGANLRAFLDVAAPECEIPWCTARAERCDFEHHTPHANGGATCSCNVGRTCRRHHRLKSTDDLPVRACGDPGHPPGTKIRTTPGGRDVVELPYAPLPPEAYQVTRPTPVPADEPDADVPTDDVPPPY